jgi:hypothetical protein
MKLILDSLAVALMDLGIEFVLSAGIQSPVHHFYGDSLQEEP